MRKLKILEQTKIQKENLTINKARIELSLPFLSKKMCLGIDPGTVNLGIAAVYPREGNGKIAYLYQVKLKRNPDPVQRMLDTQMVLSECIRYFYYEGVAVIEGSSFRGYRQTELAEVRAASVFWCIEKNVSPAIVPLAAIRKKVFGAGKMRANDFWDLPKFDDAIAALSCAYYASSL